MPGPRNYLLISIVAVTAACSTPGTWQNPDVPEDQWADDKADCQRIARQQAADDFALNQNSSRSLDSARGGQWAAQMNAFSSGERQQRLFASCMSQRGYTLKPADDSGTPPPAR